MKNLTKIGLIVFGFSPVLLALENPASVNCIKNSGKLEIRKTSRGDEYGVCVWETRCKSECEEWAFFRGTCKKNECAKWRAFYDSEGKYISECGEKSRCRIIERVILFKEQFRK